MNLQEWWAKQPKAKQQQIDKRAKRLDPNADLYGKSQPRPKVKRSRP